MITAANLSSVASFAPKADTGDGSSARPATAETAAAQKRADEKLQQLRDTLTTLKSLGNAAKSTGADLARTKLEALKQRLKMLLMLGGDPKVVAREAAQIAKEIGEAAKAYAAAGGGGSAATPAPDSGPTPQAAPTDPAAPQDSDGSASKAGSASADPAEAAAVLDGPKTPVPGGPNAKGPEASKDNPAASEKPAAKRSPAYAGLTAPDPVITEAKALAAQAKALLKAALERARRQHADPSELREDQTKMDGAEKDIREAAHEMDAIDSVSGYSPTGQGVDAPAEATAPAVSIKA